VGFPPGLAVVIVVVSCVEIDEGGFRGVHGAGEIRYGCSVRGEEEVGIDGLELEADAGEHLDAALVEVLLVDLDQVAVLEKLEALSLLRQFHLDSLDLEELGEAVVAVTGVGGIAGGFPVDVDAVDDSLARALQVGRHEPALVDVVVQRALDPVVPEPLIHPLTFAVLLDPRAALFVPEREAGLHSGDVLHAELFRDAGIGGQVAAELSEHRRAGQGGVANDVPRHLVIGRGPAAPHEADLLLFPPWLCVVGGEDLGRQDSRDGAGDHHADEGSCGSSDSDSRMCHGSAPFRRV